MGLGLELGLGLRLELGYNQGLERVEAEHAVPQQEGLLGGEVASEREGDPRRGEAHGLEAEPLWCSKLVFVGELVDRVSERE